MAARARHRCLAVCTPGLEAITASELDGLAIRGTRTIAGGVLFGATTRQLYAANLWLRTATRVLVRIASFRAVSFADLERQAEAIEWDAWLADGIAPAFRVSASKSKLYHTDAIAERLHRAAGSPPGKPGGPQQELVVRVNHDEVTISVNASGAPLHQRGWRGPAGKAPLRETLAAALLLSAGWRSSPLIDPLCGSGTIAIEAATLARNLAPGWQRSFAFGDWPTFEPGTWASVAAEASKASRPAADVPIMASDRDAGAVDAATVNAERAGVAGDVTVVRRSISDVTRPAAADGWVITNPPYGKRASAGADLRNLFARLGQLLTSELDGWSLGMLVHDRRVADHTGLPLTERLRTTNGGLDVRFLVAEPPPSGRAGGEPARQDA